MAHGSWVAAMLADTLLLAALPAIAGFIALPAFIALCRRRATREASEVAIALAEFAAASRRGLERGDRASTARCGFVRARAAAARSRIRILATGAGPAAGARRSCWQTPRSGWHCASSAASRSNARCSRAPRPAVVAAQWPRSFRRCCCWCCTRVGLVVPAELLAFVICLEAFGCWLLWRLARVGI